MRKDEGIFYLDIIRAFNHEGVKYLVVGGVAVNLYGIPRMTVDLDIAADLSIENLKKILKVMKKRRLKPHIPVSPEDLLDSEKRKEWIEKRNMFVFSFENPDRPFEILDIILEYPIPFEKMYARKVILEAEGIEIPLISRDDLIEMKKNSGRKQDLSDVEILKRIAKIEKGI
ncbi:nucleotidyl transferase AbiEii/AbiGii toxin family protein [candidate division WOR-3 bacterium]|nr:nucleotidyl transferase AbiEii/AbiGii toxin family protein [candidate division WOR-3 bacterium]